MHLLALGLAATLAVLPVVTAMPVVTTASAPVGRVLFHLADPRIGEASGIAVATREPGVWFTHNDSGDSARFFALGPTGRTLATYDVDGATNVDWEDMAAAPSPTKHPTLWFADIGDTNEPRPYVSVYAVPEPGVYPGLSGATVHVRGVRYRFYYRQGGRDAETLMVDPVTSRMYIASKSYDGFTQVYVAPEHPRTDRVEPLDVVGSITWTARPGSAYVELPAQLATTGGAFAPDGRSFVLRTYTDAYVFRLSGSGPEAVAAALAAGPQQVPLPQQPQGEGICFRSDGKALIINSERVGSAVDEVLIRPAAAAVTASPQATPGPTASSAVSTTVPRPTATTSPHPAVAVRAHHRSRLPVVGGVLVVLLVSVAGWLLRRRRGRPARSSR